MASYLDQDGSPYNVIIDRISERGQQATRDAFADDPRARAIEAGPLTDGSMIEGETGVVQAVGWRQVGGQSYFINILGSSGFSAEGIGANLADLLDAYLADL